MAGLHGAFVFIVVLAVSVSGAMSKSFTISNNCEHTVWPGILSSAGSAGMDSTGFSLSPGESRTMSVPSGWSGRLWGRTLCSTDSSTGTFTCVTGYCGSGKPECAGGGAAPPATLAEFTMDGSGGMDFFDVSLVDGYNLPLLVAPQGAAPGGNCAATGCLVDLNGACPGDLRVTSSSSSAGGVACKSACEAFGSAEYCCSGEFGNPNTCKPSAYSQFFKNACPRAYSYAYDDATSTFTCGGGDTSYAITFCPSTTSVKSAGSTPSGLPLMNGTGMVYLGADQLGAATAGARPPSRLVGTALLAIVSLALAGALH